jgi:Lon protease-like protein
LLITVRGEQRFKIQSTERMPNGLLIGDVDWIEADALLPITGEFDPVRKLLARIIHDMEESIAALPEAERGMAQRLPLPHYMDDAGWIANRITEVLPVSNAAKQKLMELQDPVARLTIVRQFLQDKKVIEPV